MTIVRLLVLYFATGLPLFAIEYADWVWHSDLPREVVVSAPRSHRTAEAVDALFHDAPSHPPTISYVLAALGLPDGFSQQFMYSRNRGTAAAAKTGGTLRFLLNDGSEVHVFTGDFRRIAFAVRYDSEGRGNLLWK